MNVFYFMVYAWGGWVLENVYSKLTAGGWKEAFLTGPFKPMYGVALILLLIGMDCGFHWSVMLLLCFAVPTAVEYVSGLLLLRLFQRRWWDYTGCRFQLHGHICLRFSCYWAALSFACLYVLHPFVASFYRAVAPVWKWMCPLLIVYVLADVVRTVWVRRRNVRLALGK